MYSFWPGLLTRLAAVPMIINMLGALLITKLPILWGGAPPLFHAESGWWDFIHESRADLAQLCGSVFLFVVGAGSYSLDARLARTSLKPTAGTGPRPTERLHALVAEDFPS